MAGVSDPPPDGGTASGLPDSGAVSGPLAGGVERELLGDPRFFGRAGPFSLNALLAETGGVASRPELAGQRRLTGVAALQAAGPDEVAVLHNPRYVAAAAQTRAGVVVVSTAMAARVPATSTALVVADPLLAWARIGWLFHPAPPAVPGVHPTAVIDATAEIGADAEIGPYAVIGPRARLGAGCVIGPHAVVGGGVQMGAGCRIGAGATLSHALLGTRVILYPGARVGQDGFGFAVTPQGFASVPQLGRVILQDGVEVGANSTVDRGASHDTVIGTGSRIDNLVQIGHNTQLGRYCAMAGQSGTAGSCTLEDFVQIGAQAGLAGHLRIGAKARIGAQAGVMSDVPAASDVIGSPALPIREFFRNVAVLRRLARRGVANEAGRAVANETGRGAAGNTQDPPAPDGSKAAG